MRIIPHFTRLDGTRPGAESKMTLILTSNSVLTLCQQLTLAKFKYLVNRAVEWNAVAENSPLLRESVTIPRPLPGGSVFAGWGLAAGEVEGTGVGIVTLFRGSQAGKIRVTASAYAKFYFAHSVGIWRTEVAAKCG